MGKSITIGLNPGYDLGHILSSAEQQLKSQGYETILTLTNSSSATMVVKKDRDGIKNVIGMGVECQANITVINGNTMTINIESEWTNKIIAVAVGWFFCLIPFITGIVGCSAQNSLPNKIGQTIQSSAAGSSSFEQPAQQ